MDEKEATKLTDEQVLQRLLAVDGVPEKTVTIPRLGIPVTLRGLTGKAVFQLREACTYRRPAKGREIETLDEEKFNCRLIAAATVKPKWDHPELLAKYQASGAEEVIKRLLLAGELAALGDLVLELSGFGVELEEVKN
ncbi:MAG: phage tail assembly chaperone [Betaproteobacteria bacterium]